MKIGTDNISAVANGADEVNKCYLGSVLVYEKDGSVLPAGYELCDYIEGTIEGDNGAYIDTGIKASSELRIVAKVYNTTSSVYGYLWGARDANTTKRFECYYYTDFTQGFFVSGSTFDTSYRTPTALVREVDVNKHRIIYDGNTITSSTTDTWTNPYNLLIGCYNHIGVPHACAAARYYYLKIYNGNTLIRDYIPAYKTSAGKYGLYDLVNDTFVSSSGAAEFSGQKNITT